MQGQRVTRIDEVRESVCVGWERPPVLRTYRVGSAALVAPTPRTP